MRKVIKPNQLFNQVKRLKTSTNYSKSQIKSVARELRFGKLQKYKVTIKEIENSLIVNSKLNNSKLFTKNITKLTRKTGISKTQLEHLFKGKNGVTRDNNKLINRAIRNSKTLHNTALQKYQELFGKRKYNNAVKRGYSTQHLMNDISIEEQKRFNSFNVEDQYEEIKYDLINYNTNRNDYTKDDVTGNLLAFFEHKQAIEKEKRMAKVKDFINFFKE